MAGLSFHKDRWVVSATISGRRRFWQFASKADAEAYMQANGLVHSPRSRGAGRGARSRAQMIDHLARNFEVTDDGCWLWTARLTNVGYAALTWRPIASEPLITGAHRVILHAIGQPVPRDKVVDHLCRNRACVNPDHLDVVQQRENVMRSPIAPGAINARKTHCSKGHPYSPENTYVYAVTTRRTTQRICRTCRSAYYKARRAQRKAVAS